MNRPLRAGRDTHRALAGVASLTLALALAACGGGGTGRGHGPGPTSLNLVIGNSLPLSGPSRELGRSGRKASLMALSEISRAVDETGSDHTVRLAPRDQGGDIDSAVSSARSLVDDENATCLTGPWSSAAVARAAQDVAIPAKVLEISPVAMADDVAELDDHDLVDSTALPVSAEGEALTTAIERELGGIEGRTVNVAVGNDPGSITIGQDFTKAWQDENGTAGGPIALSPSPSSQASVLTAGNPGAVLLADDPTGFAQLVPALSSDPGWNPASAWGSDQLVSPALPAQVGSRAIQGMRALAPGLPDDDPASAAFADRFRSASPPQVKIEPYAAQEFDATILCYLAAVAAGSTDGQEMADTLIDITAPGGTEYSWQQLPGAIKALEDGEDIDYMGASGPLDMDVHGDPTKGVFDLYRYAPRGLQVVGEVPVEKPNPATP